MPKSAKNENFSTQKYYKLHLHKKIENGDSLCIVKETHLYVQEKVYFV